MQLSLQTASQSIPLVCAAHLFTPKSPPCFQWSRYFLKVSLSIGNLDSYLIHASLDLDEKYTQRTIESIV